MRAKELIQKLQSIVDNVGDIEVKVEDVTFGDSRTLKELFYLENDIGYILLSI